MLKKDNRLKKEVEIKRVFTKGKSVFDPICGFKYMKNGLDRSRFAIMVGTKISKSAVKRNLVRRRIREIIRLNKEKIQPGWDFTLIARPGVLISSYKELEETVLSGFKKAKLLKD